VGLPGFMESLVENGLGEIVYKAVNHTEFPGWGYMIDQGATTVWESWGMLKGGYHAEESMTMLAGVGRLFYESVAGIQEPSYYGTRKFGPGYGHFQIKPYALGDRWPGIGGKTNWSSRKRSSPKRHFPRVAITGKARDES
jgi:alpha-L-rhamnosidase